MAESVRLHLGCGGKLLPGFVNIDLANNWSSVQPDVVCDVTGPLPFPDDHADEVHAYHLFEHLWRWKAEDCLKEWIRVLKPGGLLVLEMPCFDKIVTYLCHCLIEGVPFNPRLSYWGLYGDPRYQNEAMTHKWCYSMADIASILNEVGLVDIKHEEPKTHVAARDMRVTGRKPWPQTTPA